MPRKVLVFTTVITSLLFCLSFVSTAWAGTTPPITTYTQTPATPDGENGWYISPVKFDLQATDLESGVQSINYRIDTGTWQSVSFTDSLNLAPNPSFETSGSTTTGIADWEATVVDANGTYVQDSTVYLTGYAANSAKISATDGAWHGINNQNNFIVVSYLENMTSSLWMKAENVTGLAYYKVYAISEDLDGIRTVSLIGQSSSLTGTQDWTKISYNFMGSVADIIGVYIDIGLEGSGTLWVDALSVTSEALPSAVIVTVGSDSKNHTFEFYSTDVVGNTEATQTVIFKIDQTPPSNWHDSGAFRGVASNDHQLYVHSNVDDLTSGMSTLSDRYQYYTDTNPDFGKYSDLLNCASTWLSDQWADLEPPSFSDGDETAYLLTAKTDFCNSDWKICKTVKFFARDMAGNSTTKSFCINGPWLKFVGGGIVRTNHNIDMLSEPEGDNTDGLVEAGGNIIEFFTSSQDWKVKNSPTPATKSYDDWYTSSYPTKTSVTSLPTVSGIYETAGDFGVTSIPKGFSDSVFNQVIFVNGNLKIEEEIDINERSTVLFIVRGKVEVDKNVDLIEAAILADGDFYTAYNVLEKKATNTLVLKGIYSANSFILQRTLQGTNNSAIPSEDFTYEPKYALQLKEYFVGNSVVWTNVE